jgi:outer membrane usher protein
MGIAARFRFALLIAGVLLAGAASAAPRLVPLEVIVNKANVGQHTLLERDGGLYATPDTFREWRLEVSPSEPPLEYRGEKWLPLFAVPGYRSHFDFASQSVELEFSAAAFAATRLGGDTAAPAALSAKTGAVFLNYDLSHTELRGSGSSARDTGALFELGVSHGPGVLTSGFAARNLGSSDPGRRQDWLRLETLWTLDFPKSHSTLRVGDTSSAAGMWGRPVFFGGVQLARNYALSPGFLSQPIPTVAGSASGPSTVELYVNDALRQTAQVPSGPFVLENLPLLSGAGEARVVVRDVLGRETVIVRPFFSSSELLATGLSDWSVDAGRMRRNLGMLSADYGDWFTSGLYRRGLSDRLTLETRVELSEDVRSAGAGFNVALPFQVLGQAALAGSQSDGGRQGTRALLGMELALLRSGFSARVAQASRDYRELGFGREEQPYKLEFSGNYRQAVGERSHVGLNAARLATYNRGTVDTVSASFSSRLGGRGSIVFTGTRLRASSQAGSGNTLSVYVVLPLDGRRIATGSVTRRSGEVEAYAGVNNPIDLDNGLGWRALAGRRAEQAFVEGGLHYQGANGLVTADASAGRDTQALRLGALGSLVAIDGRFFASRRLQESFALVEVPGYADVGVGLQGGALTRTDKDGIALLPRLMPYQRNSIRLDPNDLPFSAELDSIEEVAVPAWRSGVKVTFPVRTGRGALIRIVLDDGEPAPPGAEIQLAGDKKEFFVARRGEAFVTGLQAVNTLRLTWKERACSFEVSLPPGKADDIARLGPFVCKGIPR